MRKVYRVALAEAISALIGASAAFLGLGVVLLFLYGVYFHFERSGYRRTGLVLIAQVPLLQFYTVFALVAAALGGLGLLVGRLGDRDAGPSSFAGSVRRFNKLGIVASLLVLATLWTMFIARL